MLNFYSFKNDDTATIGEKGSSVPWTSAVLIQ